MDLPAIEVDKDVEDLFLKSLLIEADFFNPSVEW
jgi:hypothetical protein